MQENEYKRAERPVLTLGPVSFTIGTAAFAQLQRSSEYTWATQARVGGDPALQFVGYGEESLSLPCVVFPGQSGDVRTLNTLRTLADAAEPRRLCDSLGTDHGQWVITAIGETHSDFLPTGAARKIEFSLTLKRYSRANKR